MKTKFLFLGLIMAALMFTGCAKSQDISGQWTIESLEKDGVYQAICFSDINIEKASGNSFNVSGNSGINAFNGKVTLKGNTFKADDKMASTKMAGAPEEMEFEDTFLMCLTGADKAELVDADGYTQLIITNTAKNLVLTFHK